MGFPLLLIFFLNFNSKIPFAPVLGYSRQSRCPFRLTRSNRTFPPWGTGSNPLPSFELSQSFDFKPGFSRGKHLGHSGGYRISGRYLSGRSSTRFSPRFARSGRALTLSPKGAAVPVLSWKPEAFFSHLLTSLVWLHGPPDAGVGDFLSILPFYVHHWFFFHQKLLSLLPDVLKNRMGSGPSPLDSGPTGLLIFDLTHTGPLDWSKLAFPLTFVFRGPLQLNTFLKFSF